jgi:hypothetical protein
MPASIPVILDLMEYANDAAAQAAFVTSASQGWGSDVLTGGTASASSVYGSYYADYAFDNNAGSFWNADGTGQPFWLKYDLGSGVTKIVNRYTVQSRPANEFYPIDFKLQGSNNDSGWTDLDTQTGQSFTAGEKKTYTLATPNTTAYRYYRLYVTTSADGNTYCAIAEVEMMEEIVASLQDYSEATIKQEGSYALKGIAAITSSLNKTLIRTVSPLINLSDKTIIKFDIRASRTGSNIKVGIHDSGGTTTEITPVIAAADTWQTVVWDISAVSNANKDAIDSIIVTIVNADADNTFYIDNMFADVIQNFLIHRGRDRFRTAGYSLGN